MKPPTGEHHCSSGFRPWSGEYKEKINFHSRYCKELTNSNQKTSEANPNYMHKCTAVWFKTMVNFLQLPRHKLQQPVRVSVASHGVLYEAIFRSFGRWTCLFGGMMCREARQVSAANDLQRRYSHRGNKQIATGDMR
jgi:hypothetical protein